MPAKCARRGCEEICVREIEFIAEGAVHVYTLCSDHLSEFDKLRSQIEIVYEGGVRIGKPPSQDATIPLPPGVEVPQIRADAPLQHAASMLQPKPHPGWPGAPIAAGTDKVFVIFERDATNRTIIPKFWLTRDPQWAKRWKKWNPNGDCMECTVECLPGDDEGTPSDNSEKSVAPGVAHEAQ
jgi:hypothetical protein